jgi:uridine phosphorylase
MAQRQDFHGNVLHIEVSEMDSSLKFTPIGHGEVWSEYKYRNNVPVRGFQISGRPALTGIAPELVGEYVLLFVRDPLCAYDDDPATQLSQRLENPTLVGKSGMFTAWSGYYKSAHVTAISGGSGGPEAELCMFELLEYTKATAFLRVGGSGGLSEVVHPGDLVIANGIVRAEGTSAAYVNAGWPAVCSPDLVMALAQAAHALNVRYHIGLTISSDSDLCGAGRPSVGGFIRPHQTMIVDENRRAGVLNGEREAAIIVTMATLFGRRGGACCSVADNIVTGQPFQAGAGHGIAMDVALEGIAVLHRMDVARSGSGLDHWLPSLSLGSVDETSPALIR